MSTGRECGARSDGVEAKDGCGPMLARVIGEYVLLCIPVYLRCDGFLSTHMHCYVSIYGLLYDDTNSYARFLTKGFYIFVYCSTCSSIFISIFLRITKYVYVYMKPYT